jgi:hypothetical protein
MKGDLDIRLKNTNTNRGTHSLFAELRVIWIYVPESQNNRKPDLSIDQIPCAVLWEIATIAKT